MADSVDCAYCGYAFPASRPMCPHCACPALYPNVRAAEKKDEADALARRHQAALADADRRKCRPNVEDFERAMEATHAVTARKLLDVHRLAESDNVVYTTFYQLVQGEVMLPKDEKWDTLRTAADASWFRNYYRDLRFAALSLDGTGLPGYGDCAIVWREDMIAHRTSVTESNTTTFLKKWKYPFDQLDRLPKGFRASWNLRARLCVAKLARRVDASTGAGDYQGLLLYKGSDTDDDDFVEAQIWGPMTRRTMARVVAEKPKRRRDRVILEDLREKLDKIGVRVEEA